MAYPEGLALVQGKEHRGLPRLPRARWRRGLGVERGHCEAVVKHRWEAAGKQLKHPGPRLMAEKGWKHPVVVLAVVEVKPHLLERTIAVVWKYHWRKLLPTHEGYILDC